jgi:hypothetical protein
LLSEFREIQKGELAHCLECLWSIELEFVLFEICLRSHHQKYGAVIERELKSAFKLCGTNHCLYLDLPRRVAQSLTFDNDLLIEECARNADSAPTPAFAEKSDYEEFTRALFCHSPGDRDTVCRDVCSMELFDQNSWF